MHGRFDIVFLDPPFAAALWEPALQLLPPWLADEAWLYLEAPADAVPAPGAEWLPHRDGRTRDVHYSLHRRRGRGTTAAATLAASPASDEKPSA